jgi:hypothetical protein
MIRFLYPGVLWFLLALAIPVLIHLLHLRRFKTIRFPNTAFLIKVQEERQTRDRLKKLLLLLMRLLAFAGLIIAFAEPYIPGKLSPEEMKAGRFYSFYLDNGLSMEARGEDGPLLDQAVKTVSGLLSELDERDKVQLLTNTFDADSYRALSPEEALNVLAAVKHTPVSRGIDELMIRQSEFLSASSGGGTALLFSNFREGMVQEPNVANDSLNIWRLVPMPVADPSNLYIDSVWFEQPELLPGREARLQFRLKNSSSQPQNAITVQPKMGNLSLAPIPLDLPANGYSTGELVFTVPPAGWIRGELYVQDDGMAFDDQFYFTFPIRETIKVTEVRGKNATDFTQRLFGGDSLFKYSVLASGAFDAKRLEDTDVLIANQWEEPGSAFQEALVAFVQRGGTLVWIPDPRRNQNLNSLERIGFPSFTGIDSSRTKLAPISTDHPFFQDIFERIDANMDLPAFSKRWVIQPATNAPYSSILKFLDGSPAFLQISSGEGRIMVSAAPFLPSWTNMGRHALFVPILLKTAFQSLRTPPLAYFLESTPRLNLPAHAPMQDPVYSLRALDKSGAWILTRRLIGGNWFLECPESLEQPGFYELYVGEEPVAEVAFNYDRKESAIRSANLEEWIEQAKDRGYRNVEISAGSDVIRLAQGLKTDGGTALWRWFLGLALLALLMEMLILRLWRS